MDLSRAAIGQILVPVENLEKGIEFYRDVLGLQFLFSAPPQMSFFQCGNVRLLVGVHEDSRRGERGSQIYFTVGDIHAVHRTLSERGAVFSAAPHVVHRTAQSELWLAEFVDPDGNPLALMSEVPAGS